jgi:hypothetical protein
MGFFGKMLWGATHSNHNQPFWKSASRKSNPAIGGSFGGGLLTAAS